MNTTQPIVPGTIFLRRFLAIFVPLSSEKKLKLMPDSVIESRAESKCAPDSSKLGREVKGNRVALKSLLQWGLYFGLLIVIGYVLAWIVYYFTAD